MPNGYSRRSSAFLGTLNSSQSLHLKVRQPQSRIRLGAPWSVVERHLWVQPLALFIHHPRAVRKISSTEMLLQLWWNRHADLSPRALHVLTTAQVTLTAPATAVCPRTEVTMAIVTARRGPTAMLIRT